MSDYLVYHNTEGNGDHSLVNDHTRPYRFDIYTSKNVDHLRGKIVWLIEGRRDKNSKNGKKSFYLVERFRVHDTENGEEGEQNWAYGKINNGERYIKDKTIRLNDLSWFPNFQHRMANFSLGLTKLSDKDRSYLVSAIKKYGYAEEFGKGRLREPSPSRRLDADAPSELLSSSTAYGPGFGDAETNQKIDQAAMKEAESYYTKAKWKVSDKSNVGNLGYDLLCTKGNVELHVEVKGCSGAKESFFLKRSQKECAETDPCFRLAVVTNALTKPTLKIRTGIELLRDFNLTPTEYCALPKGNRIARRGEERVNIL